MKSGRLDPAGLEIRGGRSWKQLCLNTDSYNLFPEEILFQDSFGDDFH